MDKVVFAGVDIGHSAVKMTFDREGTVERVFFPSLVSPALAITDEAERERARRETVIVGDKTYWVGETARIQGGVVSSGLIDDWVLMDQHKALVAQAARIIRENADGAMIYLTTGLPVALYSKQKNEIRQQFIDYLPAGSQVFVIPQPMAGYYHAVLNRTGTLNPQRSISQDSYAIIDIGFYTTDFVMVREGRWVQAGASSAPGVKLAVDVFVDAMRRIGLACDVFRAEEALSTGRLRSVKHPEQNALVHTEIRRAFAALSDAVYDEFHRIAGSHADILDGIFVIGGAAEEIIGRMRDKYRIAEVPTDQHVQPQNSYMNLMGWRERSMSGPRWIVSEGLYRFSRNGYALSNG